MALAPADFPSPEDIQRACASIPGSNILEVSPGNAWSYACGSFELVQRDLRAVLPAALADDVELLLRRLGVPEAFTVRTELVNYKKVMLYVHQQGVLLERSLAQLNTFLNYDATARRDDEYWVPSPWSAELLETHMQCKGRCMATADVRRLCKEICCLPRHPSEPLGLALAALEQLPRSLQTWSIGAQAEATVAAGAAAKETLEAGAAVSKAREDKSAKGRLELKRSSWRVQAVREIECQEWPEHVKACVQAVLVCRGADKALRIRDELQKLSQAIEAALLQGETALAELLRFPDLGDLMQKVDSGLLLPDELKEATAQAAVNHTPNCTRAETSDARKLMVKAATWRQRHINLLSGAVPPLRESAKWLRAIEAAATGEAAVSLFVAGDSRGDGALPALCVPSGFEGCKALDDGFRAMVSRHKPAICRAVASDGWPEHISPPSETLPPQEERPRHKCCRVCGRQFASTLWVLNQVCSACEQKLRDEGRCPFKSTCSAAWFCRHAQRCFACDGHSCTECRILRGDGELVRDLVERIRPARVSLDFDRTLANTKSGRSPVIGKHTVDMELLSLLQLHPSACAVVTRNPHKEEICAFLSAHGAPDNLKIQTLKGRSKAEYVVEDLSASEQALFVDDSIAELVDPCIAGDSRILRILFVRALL